MTTTLAGLLPKNRDQPLWHHKTETVMPSHLSSLVVFFKNKCKMVWLGVVLIACRTCDTEVPGLILDRCTAR